MERLKQLRGDRTQAQMAALLGLARETYRNYETGQREPDQETLIRMARYFEVSVDYLLGVSSDPRPDPAEQWQAPPQLDGVYFRLAKEAQELGLPPEDIQHIIDLYKKYKVRDD